MSRVGSSLRYRRVTRSVLRSALALAWLAACSASPERVQHPGKDVSDASREQRASELPSLAPPSLVLISIDTLRADHLGCYGHSRASAPTLDALAAEAIRYADATTPAGWTFPAHVALLTGRHPYEIGLRGDPAEVPPVTMTLAALLHERGYQTAAFVDSAPDGFVGSRWGFARGFDVYEHAPHAPGLPVVFKYDVRATVAAALAWLDARDSARPFFLFLHTKSVHAVPRGAACDDPHCYPYDKPEPHRSRFLASAGGSTFAWSAPGAGQAQDFLWSLNHALLAGTPAPRALTLPTDAPDTLARLYDGGVAYVDDGLRRFRDGLRARALDAGTVLAITSDHGEAFGEHRFFMHMDAYQEELHVPLIVRPARGTHGSVVTAPVSTVALAGTLLDLVGAGDAAAELPRLPASDDAAASGEPIRAYYRLPSEIRYEAFALREDRFKLVLHDPGVGGVSSHQLFDLMADPAEREPIRDQPERLAAMRARLDAWRNAPAAIDTAAGASPPATDELLRSLGYVE